MMQLLIKKNFIFMTNTSKIVLFLSLFLSACSWLPGSGPNHSKILKLQEEQDLQNKVKIVDVNAEIVQAIMNSKQEERFSAFKNKSAYGETIRVGDSIEIKIWEAPPAVLFGGGLAANSGAGKSDLPIQTVNSSGMVSVPFVGDIKVAGKTTEQVQEYIRQALANKANQPQVLVSISNNNAQTVTIIRQGKSMKMPLTVNREKVLDAVAAVGGGNAETNEMAVQLTRGNEVKKISLDTLISDARENIVLNSGDVVTLIHNPYSFTGMGAVKSTKEVRFSTKGINLAEAIAQMGGLIDSRSDSRGVFVFRQTPFHRLPKEEQEQWKARGYAEGLDVPTVYRVDLLNPQTLFLIQKFPIEDKDVIYVSNAPLAEFQKFLSMIFSMTSQGIGTVSKIDDL